MASGILQQEVFEEPIEIESRGIVALFPEPLNEKAEAVMISNGIRVEEHDAKQLSEEDFAEDTMIVALEEAQYQSILDRFEIRENVYLLAGLIGEKVVLSDPYGKGLPEYGKCFEELRAFIEKFAEILRQMD